MFIVDAHLDLSYNALRGRDVTLPARQQPPDAEGTPSVGLPDLVAGQVGLVCATIFTEPAARNDSAGYHSQDEAHEQAKAHLAWYQQQVAAGRLTWVRSRRDLPSAPAAAPGFVLLMEGADPLRSEADVDWWWSQGLRIVGLAWRRTQLAGGTGAPGPLTPLGRRIAGALDRAGFIHDTSHLAEQSFWDLLEMTQGPVMASHSNARAIIPTDRQLSDEMAHAIVQRGGVIGINFYRRFLVPAEQADPQPTTLADVVRHMRYFADLFGSTGSIAIGTDMDGGFGRESIPVEIETSADLPKLADALAEGGFSDGDIAGIMGGNWLAFFARALPSG